jgi:hypothetical protein
VTRGGHGSTQYASRRGNWRYDVGRGYPGGPQNGFGTSEVEMMTDSTANVALDGAGNLKITARRDGPTDYVNVSRITFGH